MSLPNDTSQDGATPATNQTVINAELAEWVYHRAANDQGLSLQDIEVGAEIYDPSNSTFQANLPKGYSFGTDGFIYNKATGFCCAIVKEDGVNFAIVVRGTDLGDGSLTAAIADAAASTPSHVPGGDDELDVYQDLQQGLGTLLPTQIDDVLNVIQALKSSVTGANIRLVGQSLGGGDAAAAATIDGLAADVFDPAPFAKQINAEDLKMAAQSVGVVLPGYGLTLDPVNIHPDVEDTKGSAPDIVSVGDYVASMVSSDEYDVFLANYNEELQDQSDADISAYSIKGELLSGGVTGTIFGAAASRPSHSKRG